MCFELKIIAWNIPLLRASAAELPLLLTVKHQSARYPNTACSSHFCRNKSVDIPKFHEIFTCDNLNLTEKQGLNRLAS
jgi:hypothetical protein